MVIYYILCNTYSYCKHFESRILKENNICYIYVFHVISTIYCILNQVSAIYTVTSVSHGIICNSYIHSVFI
jgi:hypothetical protein